MRKFLITILAALVAGGLVSAQNFPDIPSGHWAGDAVSEIADLGIVIGFPDGTFRGNEAFTRYQSALVISRLLAVVDANMAEMDAAHTDAIAALRASMQELAADVAAQGVRLAAAESAVAGLSDNVAANAARLDAVEAMLADMPEGMDEAVLRDLQNQIASQRVAIDTAQAQAEAAEARANGAYDLALQALAAADANASDISALNQTLQLLSQRVDGLGGPAPVAAPVDLSGIARNAGDIANIREFVILLRRDQVALRDRVSALEAADAEIAASVTDLEARVSMLETNPFGFSGSITVDYFVGRTLGAYGFDVDRAYGVNAPESMGNSYFSTGSDELNADDDETDVGEVAQDRADIEQTTGVAVATLDASLSFEYAVDGTSSPRGLNSFTAVAEIEIDYDDVTEVLSFDVTEFTTTFEPIGAAPLTFTFGEEVDTAFTGYVFNRDDENGFLATVGAPDFLAFLNPGLTIAYLSDTADGYMRGINGTMAPTIAEGIELSGGVSFVQYAQNAADKDDVLGNNVTQTVWGVDGMASLLGLVDLDFEYATDSTDGVANGNVLYVVADVNGDSLPILNSLGGNYRAMDAGFDGLNDDTVDDPFELGQSGFGVEAGLGLFILDVTGFFDSYTHEASTNEIVGFGVEVSADLFAGFSLTGFFESASVDGAAVDGNTNVSDVEGYSLLDGEYDTKFGVGIEHDGAADNALIANLNIAAGYERWNVDYTRTRIYAEADYSLDISIVSLSPYVGFESDNDTVVGTDDFTELVAGVGVQTQALDIILKPSLMAAANYRSTTYTDLNDFTASELQWSVGVNLDEFLFPYSTLTAKFGSWTGTNTNDVTDTLAADGATDISGNDDVDNGGAVETVMGYEVVWNYFDLEFGYGVYTSDRDGSLASAQAFSITYTVDF